MAELVNSGVSAQFDSDVSAVLRIVEDTTEEGSPACPYGFAWLRVWSSTGTPVLTSTSGQQVQLVNSSVSVTVTETVMFNNSDRANLSACNVTIQKIETVGLFLGSDGDPITMPNIVADSATGELHASTRCFGAASITYTTLYARYSCAFSRDPNASKGDPTATPPTQASASAFAPMMVVARRGALLDSASLTPPPRSADPKNGTGAGDGDGLNGGGAITWAGAFDTNDGGSGPNIVIELDTKHPVGLDVYGLASSSGGLTAFAHIWVYFGPLTTVTPIVSEGEITMDYGGGSGKNSTTDVTIINEPVRWSNSTSAPTNYLPSGGVSVEQTSSAFFVKHSGKINPLFQVGEGSSIFTKVFTGPNIYRIGDMKVLEHGEIVAVDGGLAVACSGQARASYTTRRMGFSIRWGRQSSELNAWFNPVTVSVTSGGKSGSLVINPPARTGKL